MGNTVLESIFSPQFAFSVLRLTTPILFAALAALITDRAGIINIGLEGIMLICALTGVLGSAYSQSLLVGFISAAATGVLVTLVMAYFSLKLKVDIILAGVAVNLTATGGTIFILYSICGDKGVSSSLNSLVFPSVQLPLIGRIPVLGEILSGHNVLTYVALIMVFAVWFFMEKTKLGLRIRCVGENENAARSVGINVIRIRCMALLISGLLASMGGMFLSMGMLTYFSKNMTAGRGFIAMAAEALGQGGALGSFLASLVFGAAEALSINLQVLGLPPQFVQMLPYVVTILGLVVYSLAKKKRLSSKNTI